MRRALPYARFRLYFNWGPWWPRTGPNASVEEKNDWLLYMSKYLCEVRNRLGEQALKDGCEYVVWFDDDELLMPDLLVAFCLFMRDYPCLMCGTRSKNSNFKQGWTNEKLQQDLTDKYYEIHDWGMPRWYSKEALELIPRPWWRQYSKNFTDEIRGMIENTTKAGFHCFVVPSDVIEYA